MTVTIPAIGSRGDVQAYVALAAGLHRAGHVVRFVTTTDFADLAREYDLAVEPVPFCVQAAHRWRTAARRVCPLTPFERRTRAP